jgi:hypothetical protein
MQLLPPLHAARSQVDGDQRVGARVRAGRRPGSRAASPSRCRSTACSSSCRRRWRPDRAAADDRASARRQDWSRAGPSRTALGQAGFRSVVYAITKPRIRTRSRRRRRCTRLLAQIGALVSNSRSSVRVRHVLAERRRRATLPSRRPQRTSFMSSCEMNRRPSQYASPRLATMPKFLKMPLLAACTARSPCRCAVEREDVVVVRRHDTGAPPIASGYDCWPRRTSGSSRWKSML